MQTFPPPVATGTPDVGEPLTCVLCHTDVSPAAEVVDCGDGPEHVGCHESDDRHLEAPAVTPWVRLTPDLAGVLAGGVEPTDEDMASARRRMAAAVDVTAVMCAESGAAGALGATMAGAVRRGDADMVAYGIRTLLALQAAASERVDAILAALGSVR